MNLYFRAIIFFLISVVTYAQTDNIGTRNKELESIRKDIQSLEHELKNKSAKERESLLALENLGKQNLLMGKVLGNLTSQANQKLKDIGKTEKNISEVERRTALLKEKYSKYIVWVYKNRGTSQLRFLFHTDSFNQTLKRYKYLQFISESNERTLSNLLAEKDELSSLKTQLETERKEKEELVQNTIKEQNVLIEKQKQRRELVAALKKDQGNITKEIEMKRQAEIQIKNIIARLIEEERVRRTKLLESKPKERNNVPTYNYGNLENFLQLKGNMNWPVRGGQIVRKFGENRNERLKTVTLNYGIDIKIRDDQKVLSVAEGYVSAIDWIPGYGSIVIITHKDEYRTVYGHVADISVKEGQKVAAGDIIGRVNESLEGAILHFEIWNERNYQNPEVWLAKK